MSFIDGVHHLIAFEANLLLLSPSLSRNECLRLRLLVFHLHASHITSFTLLAYILHASQHSSRFIFRKRSGDEGIWTLDPWSGNLLRWPLDHTTPPYLIFVTFKVVQKVLVLYFVIVYFSFLRNKFLIHGQK